MLKSKKSRLIVKTVLLTAIFGSLGLVTMLVLEAAGQLSHNHASHSHAVPGAVNPAQLPLGDGKISQAPQQGYIYSCATTFNGPGSFTDGPWIQGTTWDSTAKVTVDGNVSWPNASFQTNLQNNQRQLSGNNLPPHTTGVFPISPNDDAYQYDRNPNSISSQTLSVTLVAQPTEAAAATCLPGGNVAIATTGIPIFNGLDAQGRDAVAHEIQDNCGGHPQQQGSYHYHSLSPCINGGTSGTTLIGYALDGFGLYGLVENGNELTNSDLDDCHGHKHTITWDGQATNMYHYHVTREYPYTIGCFKGNICLPRVVTRSTDDATGTTCGTLSYNLARTLSNGATQNLVLNPAGGVRTITFTSPPASLELKTGVQLDGAGSCNNPLTINGGSSNVVGLVLRGKNVLKNIQLTGFSQTELLVTPPAGGKNTLQCIKVFNN